MSDTTYRWFLLALVLGTYALSIVTFYKVRNVEALQKLENDIAEQQLVELKKQNAMWYTIREAL